MTYALRDHTADVAVEATGETLSELFAAVADGLTAASCESVPTTGDRFAFTVRAERPEALLFDYLDRLIYERDVRAVLPADHRCSVSGSRTTTADTTTSDTTTADTTAVDTTAAEGADGRDDDAWTVDASARGVPLDDVTAREIKAVTYSEMTLERRDGEWYAYVVFDV
ncbi:archease [Halorubrum sp. BV1]|uniref:archease n=1 Tax=Halorubrum sp. BV1 TaxID=1498500 RepID=UPI000678DDCC|nr:archease [Halorubrum sp. BV1]